MIKDTEKGIEKTEAAMVEAEEVIDMEIGMTGRDMAEEEVEVEETETEATVVE
jgi:hypothetical protein